MDRRESLLDRDDDDDDAATSMSPHRMDVFGDENEVDDFDGVADGFRPGHDRHSDDDDDDLYNHDGPERRSLTDVQPSFSRRSSEFYAATANGSLHSTPKARHEENPFASPADGEVSPALQFESDGSALRKSASTASSHMYARTNSPRFAASGPSHPYGMYPQGTAGRSSSIRSSSIIQPAQRQSSLRREPQHPYTLYPQGVADDLDDEDEERIPHIPVPVGFFGRGQNYQRQVGPDGEEQDIIGEDGHAEQLPPYTRYPDEMPEKLPLMLPNSLHSRAPVAGTDPGMPLMHTPLQPSRMPEPMTDGSNLALLHSRTSSDSVPPSEENLSTGTRKSWSEKSWKEKRKTKFCGVPFLWIVIVLASLAFITALLGGVIGGFVAGKEHSDSDGNGDGDNYGNPAVSTVTSLIDASVIASPTVKNPPTGTFALSLSTPQESEARCLPDMNQRPAWDCTIAPTPEVAIVVSQTPGGPWQCGASIFYASNDSQITYGMQAPYMETIYSPFLIVQDTQDTSAGQAFLFQAFYDKVVVVPEDALQAPNNPSKRDDHPYPDFNPNAWSDQKQAIAPGERPWFCVWNGTYVEGFIFVDEPLPPSVPVSSMSPTVMSISTGMASSSSYRGSITLPTPGYTPTNTPLAPSSTTPESYVTSSSTPSSNASYRPGGDHNKRQVFSNADYSAMPVYPYMVKLEERRLPGNSVKAYCQQFQLLDNGGTNPVNYPNTTEPIIIQLNEQDPSYSAYQSADADDSSSKYQSKHRKRGLSNVAGCHCQWTNGQ